MPERNPSIALKILILFSFVLLAIFGTVTFCVEFKLYPFTTEIIEISKLCGVSSAVIFCAFFILCDMDVLPYGDDK
jgi:hypothetical protein